MLLKRVKIGEKWEKNGVGNEVMTQNFLFAYNLYKIMHI